MSMNTNFINNFGIVEYSTIRDTEVVDADCYSDDGIICWICLHNITNIL